MFSQHYPSSTCIGSRDIQIQTNFNTLWAAGILQYLHFSSIETFPNFSSLSSTGYREKNFNSDLFITLIGLFPENIHTPLWTTLNWVSKNFRISKKDNCSFEGFQSLLIQNLEEFQNFAKTFNGFPGSPVKIYKILGSI